jgi:hypothetical protein
MVLVLAACVPVPGARAPVPLQDGAVLVAAPAGYCASADASGDVVVFGRCAGASGAEPAVIAVTVGGEGSSAFLQSGAAALSDYVTSPEGRAALARDGRAASVRIGSVAVAEGALVIRLTDRALGEHWRALLPLRGRAVSVTVTAPPGAVLSPEAGRQLLDRTISALRAANAGA